MKVLFCICSRTTLPFLYKLYYYIYHKITFDEFTVVNVFSSFVFLFSSVAKTSVFENERSRRWSAVCEPVKCGASVSNLTSSELRKQRLLSEPKCRQTRQKLLCGRGLGLGLGPRAGLDDGWESDVTQPEQTAVNPALFFTHTCSIWRRTSRRPGAALGFTSAVKMTSVGPRSSAPAAAFMQCTSATPGGQLAVVQ